MTGDIMNTDTNMVYAQCRRILETSGELDAMKRSINIQKDNLYSAWSGGEAAPLSFEMERIVGELSRIVFDLEDIQRDIKLCIQEDETEGVI